ncbi:MAG: methyltransferase domain-containing protein [Actinomycetota bacterium]|nr:methyltransferase domain-containing protein [Actinomycetota bacterium]
MYLRLLDFLRCPDCGGALELEAFASVGDPPATEVSEGLLHCQRSHWFPIVGGIPRMLPDSLRDNWSRLQPHLSASQSPVVQEMVMAREPVVAGDRGYDERTKSNFSREWEHHEVGDKTWGIDLEDRVRGFFLESIRIPVADLDGMVMLDAGCGNGSQSVAYTRFGVEVIALDLSSGLEHGQEFRSLYDRARPDLVHFVQGDLQSPPLAAHSVDLVHSAGVLHHTSNTEQTFRRLCPLLKSEATFYVWLYSYEPVVTPVVNTLRAATTRLPPRSFARVAETMAGAFQVFCAAVDRLGIRSYPILTRREATLALMDIFGAPYAHYHSFPEVEQWYRDEGFDDVWECNRSRRGFGACGRRAARADDGSAEIEPSHITAGR